VIFGVGFGGYIIIGVLIIVWFILMLLASISGYKFNKNRIWKLTFVLSLITVSFISYILAPLIFDLRQHRALKINLNQKDKLLWVSSDFKCVSYDFSPHKDCESKVYVNKVDLELPDDLRIKFESDNILLSESKRELLSVSFNLRGMHTRNEAYQIIKKNVKSWSKEGENELDSKGKYIEILEKLDNKDKPLSTDKWLGYGDDVCVIRLGYHICMGFQGQSSIQLMYKIIFNRKI